MTPLTVTLRYMTADWLLVKHPAIVSVFVAFVQVVIHSRSWFSRPMSALQAYEFESMNSVGNLMVMVSEDCIDEFQLLGWF